jgi:hypothetical protein
VVGQRLADEGAEGHDENVELFDNGNRQWPDETTCSR